MAQRPRRITAALVFAGIGALCSLGAMVVYEEPKSFYTNFVIFPAVLLMGIGLLADLVAIILALTGLRGEGRKPALLALALAIVSPILAMAVIQLLQLD
jgi:hypothetical protein